MFVWKMKNNKGFISNLKWKFAERIIAQIVTTVVSIVLARLLEPQHYGMISIVMVFITIANVFVSDGLGVALIQKKDADSLDYSSALFINIFMSILMYIILFVISPRISLFYGDGYGILAPVLRVLGLSLILSAINSIQNAYISKNMIFETFFWAALIGTTVSAVVGITMAYTGFGVWALVGQYLTNKTIDTVVLVVILKKRPGLNFSCDRAKVLIGYGIKILTTSLLINLFEAFRSLLIGKIYSSSDLAYYDKGQQFPKLIIININTSISSVLFPKMANEQDDLSVLKEITRKSIRFSSYFMCPMMIGLAAIAESFVSVVLTDKWLSCVSLLQLFCVYYLFQPIHTANIQAIKARGRVDIYLKLEIFKKIIEVVTLFSVINISVKTIVISMAVLAALFTFVNAFPNKKLLNYSFEEQVKDILTPMIMSLFMAGCVLIVPLVVKNKLLALFIQVVVGIFVYLAISIITKNKELIYVWGKINHPVKGNYLK